MHKNGYSGKNIYETPYYYIKNGGLPCIISEE
jgi:hypothetical protein